MDRDVYLILVGAGISLASSIITLTLQFLFGMIADRIRIQRATKMQNVAEIKSSLIKGIDKSDKELASLVRTGRLLGKLPLEDSERSAIEEYSKINRNQMRVDKAFRKALLRKAFLRARMLVYGRISIGVGFVIFVIWMIYIFYFQY